MIKVLSDIVLKELVHILNENSFDYMRQIIPDMTYFMLVCCLTYSVTLKMIYLYWTMQHYIPQDGTVHAICSLHHVLVCYTQLN
jgi:hypothetical protein